MIEEPKRLQTDGDSGCTCKMPNDHHSTDCAKFDAEPPVEGEAGEALGEYCGIPIKVDPSLKPGEVRVEYPAPSAPSGEDGEGAVPTWIVDDVDYDRGVVWVTPTDEATATCPAKGDRLCSASELTRVKEDLARCESEFATRLGMLGDKIGEVERHRSTIATLTEERDEARAKEALTFESQRACVKLHALRLDDLRHVEAERNKLCSQVEEVRDWAIKASAEFSRFGATDYDHVADRLSRILSPGSEGS